VCLTIEDFFPRRSVCVVSGISSPGSLASWLNGEMRAYIYDISYFIRYSCIHVQIPFLLQVSKRIRYISFGG